MVGYVMRKDIEEFYAILLSVPPPKIIMDILVTTGSLRRRIAHLALAPLFLMVIGTRVRRLAVTCHCIQKALNTCYLLSWSNLQPGEPVQQSFGQDPGFTILLLLLQCWHYSRTVPWLSRVWSSPMPVYKWLWSFMVNSFIRTVDEKVLAFWDIIAGQEDLPYLILPILAASSVLLDL